MADIFCQIASGDMKGDIVYKDDRVTAFRDIKPVAPVHILIIPNKHISGAAEAEERDEALIGHLVVVARKLAEQEGIAQTGYRLVINNGENAGQAVPHLHLHLIGGRAMKWPPG